MKYLKQVFVGALATISVLANCVYASSDLAPQDEDRDHPVSGGVFNAIAHLSVHGLDPQHLKIPGLLPAGFTPMDYGYRVVAFPDLDTAYQRGLEELQKFTAGGFDDLSIIEYQDGEFMVSVSECEARKRSNVRLFISTYSDEIGSSGQLQDNVHIKIVLRKNTLKIECMLRLQGYKANEAGVFMVKIRQFEPAPQNTTLMDIYDIQMPTRMTNTFQLFSFADLNRSPWR